MDNNKIELALSHFWNLHINSSQHRFALQFKLKFAKGDIRSISFLQIVNKDDLNQLAQIFMELGAVRSEDYHIALVEKIIFTFRFIKKKRFFKLTK